MFIDQQAFLLMSLNQVQRQMQRQRGSSGPSFGSHHSHDSALHKVARLALGARRYMRQRVRYPLRLKWLHQIFRTSRPHSGDDLLRIGATRGGEDSQAAVAAIVKPLGDTATLLRAVLKIDHADAMLIRFQHFHGFAGSNVPIDAVSYTHLRAHETDSYLVCRLLLE